MNITFFFHVVCYEITLLQGQEQIQEQSFDPHVGTKHVSLMFADRNPHVDFFKKMD